MEIINTSGVIYYADNTQYNFLLSPIFAALQTGKSQAAQGFCFPLRKQAILFYLKGWMARSSYILAAYQNHPGSVRQPVTDIQTRRQRKHLQQKRKSKQLIAMQACPGQKGGTLL